MVINIDMQTYTKYIYIYINYQYISMRESRQNDLLSFIEMYR